VVGLPVRGTHNILHNDTPDLTTPSVSNAPSTRYKMTSREKRTGREANSNGGHDGSQPIFFRRNPKPAIAKNNRAPTDEPENKMMIQSILMAANDDCQRRGTTDVPVEH
jgi:hypothetical protein